MRKLKVEKLPVRIYWWIVLLVALQVSACFLIQNCICCTTWHSCFPTSFLLRTGSMFTELDNNSQTVCILGLRHEAGGKCKMTSDKSVQATVRPTRLKSMQADVKKSTASHSTQTKHQTALIGMLL